MSVKTLKLIEMKKVMAIAMLAAITFCIGCSKYEDGPVASLLTKKQRITGKYDVESWDTEGEILIDLDDLEIEFFKDNSVKVQFIEDGVVRTQQGEWSFRQTKNNSA